MKQSIFEIKTNRKIAKNTFEMVLAGDTTAITAPGQFVNIKLKGFFLRRPISVCNWNDESLDILTGLGNGFECDPAISGKRPVLIGGGAGVPPLYGLAKALIARGIRPQVILGFNTAEEVFYRDEFEKLGADLHITTADGSIGTKGFVTDVMKELDYTYFYTCGPEPMLKAIERIAVTSGQYSFEERMGCGFGACMGCSCKTKYGNKRICKEGPVLEREEIIW